LKLSKKSFFKIIFEKWDKSIGKRIITCIPSQILAAFWLIVGEFSGIF